MSAMWVDGDGCPRVIREILFRAAQRKSVPLTVVANHPQAVPRHPRIRFLQVAPGLDVADSEIARRVNRGDLVVTNDIPLAADVIEKGALALSGRGELYTRENIRGRLNIRDFMDTLRASGVDTGGPPKLSHADRKAFAGHLDRWLAHLP